jgi:hypothetical protein
MMPAGRVLFICDGDDESLRRRALYPAEAMASLGVQSDVVRRSDAGVEELATGADAVVLIGFRDGNADLLERLHQRSIPLFFDGNALQDTAHSTLRDIDTVLCATPQQADVIARTTGWLAIVLPDGVSRRVARLADDALRIPRIAGPVRIGVHARNQEELRKLQPVIAEVLLRQAYIQFYLIGSVDVPEELRGQLRSIPEQPWYRMPALLRQMDIIMVQRDGSDAEHASPVEWLDAALVAVPTVASASLLSLSVLTHGTNGLAARNTKEWLDALGRLIVDAAERHRLGNRARRDVLFRFSPWLVGRGYAEALGLSGRKGERKRSENESAGDKRHNRVRSFILAPIAERTRPQVPTLRMRASRSVEFPLPTNAAGAMQIDLMIATFRNPGRALRATLFDDSDTSGISASAMAFEVGDRAWTSFHFQADREMKRPWLRVELLTTGDDPMPLSSGSGPIALWADRAGVHRSKGEVIAGGPCVRVWGDPEIVHAHNQGESSQLTRFAKIGARLRFAEYLLRTEGTSVLTKRVVGFFTQRG